jgi:hypothetical protein
VQHEAARTRATSTTSALDAQRPATSPRGRADVEADRAALAERFPDWRVWLSDAGHWYATRRQPIAPGAGCRFGRVRMVDGRDAVRLLAELLDQVDGDEQARHEIGAPC